MDSCRYGQLHGRRHAQHRPPGRSDEALFVRLLDGPFASHLRDGDAAACEPEEVFASEVYKDEYTQWRLRTGFGEIAFKEFLPDLSLPKVLRKLGYRTVAKVLDAGAHTRARSSAAISTTTS